LQKVYTIMISFPWAKKSKKREEKKILKDHLKKEKQVQILLRVAKKRGFSHAVGIALQLEDPWVLAEFRKEVRRKKYLATALSHL